MAKEDNLPKLFLEDGTIADLDLPIPKGYIDTGIRPNAYTQIKKPLGINQVIAETAGDFMVYASAAKYLADIIRSDRTHVFLEGEKSWRELVEGPSEELVLFSGGIQIYERGLPEMKDTFHLRKVEKIWYAEKPILHHSNDLKTLIFGDSKKDADRVERIESILRGYEAQEIAESRQQSRERHDEYQRGRFDVTAP